MLTLAVVTCTSQLEVALAGEPVPGTSVVRLAGRSPRSTLLLAAADLLLEDAGVCPEALTRVVVTRGPGSFTGIRAGLATALGLQAATGAEILAYDSLTTQAARTTPGSLVWTAQPGRRGEVYVRPFRVGVDPLVEATGPLDILAIDDAGDRGPWVAAESVDLGAATRAHVVRCAAEALIELARASHPPGPVEPLYVEGPPVCRRAP